MKFFRSLIVVCLAAVWMITPLQTGFAQGDSPEDSPVSDDLLAQFEAIIQSEMAYYHIPGAAVAVIQDGEIVYSQGFGVRSLETGEPFTPQTQFRIGSTTKSMTSLLIAQLVDEGVLDWDTLVTDVYPDFQTGDPDLTAKLTMRDLMSMGTGLESDDMLSLDWGQWTEADVFESIAAQPVAGDYRQHYAYNNEVYASAAYIAAMAAGEAPTLATYIDMIQTRLFDPVAMPSTLITDDRDQLGDNYAESYSFTLLDSITRPVLALPAPIHVVAPAGAVWSTVDDMARYVITQMNGGITPDGTRIVSEANLAETWVPQVVVPVADPEFDSMAYAMGWLVGSYEGIPFRYHDGGWDGYRTQMAIFPETQTGLIIFTNHLFGSMFNDALMYAFGIMLTGGDPAPLLTDVRAAFDRNYSSIDQQIKFLPPAEVALNNVEPLLGQYEQGWTVEWREDDGLLRITRPNWEFVLRPLPGEEQGYLVASGAAVGTVIQFVIEGDQVTMNLDMGDGEVGTFGKIE
ncbi:MAG: beta-lactamase family protein [Anaerolineae bacterium]|nr:beta-lactamase family protein [Anaerolineae bacterium]